MNVGTPEEIIKFLEDQDPERVFKITRFYKSRTLKQNSYLHAIFNAISLETGEEMRVIKNYLKYVYLEVIQENGIKYIQETSTLNTKETTDFIAKIKVWALDNLNFLIPDPDTEEALKFYDKFIKISANPY